MSNKYHKELTGTDIHIIHVYEYADETARTSATDFVSADIGKVAKQIDNGTFWILKDTTPTWSQIDSQAGNASQVDFDPTNNIIATDVQAAIEELDVEKEKLANKNVANGYAPLDSDVKVPMINLPNSIKTDVFSVANEAEQLSLTAEEGDVAIRTDENKSYNHNGGTAGTMADWSELLSPTESVFEKSTGLIEGGEITINAGDNTLIDITAGEGQVVDSTTDPDNPVLTPVEWDIKEGYNLTTTTAGDMVAIFLSLDSSGDVIERTALPTPEQRRDTIDLGIVARISSDQIVFAGSGPQSIIHNPGAQLHDLMQALGPFNIDGNRIEPHTTAMQITKREGNIFRNGANFPTDRKNPHMKLLDEQVGATFNYKLSDGTDISSTTDIDPEGYDDGTSTLATVPNNKWTVQYITVFASGVVEVLPGQEVFANEEEAVTALANMDITTPADSKGAIPLAYLVLQQGDTSLPTNRFYHISRVGTGGGSISYWNRIDGVITPSNDGDDVLLATRTELASYPNLSADPDWTIFSGDNTWTYDAENDRMIPTGENTGDTIANTGISLTSGKTYVVTMSWEKSSGSLQLYQGSGGTLISDYTDDGTFTSRRWMFIATANENLFVRTSSGFHDDTTTDYVSELSVIEIDNKADITTDKIALGGALPEYYDQLDNYEDIAAFFPSNKGIFTLNEFIIRNINSGGLDFDETYARPMLSSYDTSVVLGSSGYDDAEIRADDNINLRTYTDGGTITLNEGLLDTDLVLNGDGVEAYKYDAGDATHTFTGDVSMPNLINDQASSNYFDIGTMRIQWGTEMITSDSAITVTLPAAFATAVYTLAVSIDSSASAMPGTIGNPIRWNTKTTTTFNLDRHNDVTGTMGIDWMVIGLKP